MVVTLLCYAVVTVAVFCGLPTRAVVYLGARLAVLLGRVLGPLVAAAAVWSAIAGLWRLADGHPIPVVVWVLAYAWVGWAAQRQRVSLGGFVIAIGEQGGIALVAIVSAIAWPVRWY